MITQNILQEVQTCPAVGYQRLSVCVPVTVTPFAAVGGAVTRCCGEPIVEAGARACDGRKNGSCTFTVTQDICVAVPVNFGATATAGDSYVNCGVASASDVCESCLE